MSHCHATKFVAHAWEAASLDQPHGDLILIVTLVFSRKAAAEFFSGQDNNARVVGADRGTAMLRFETKGDGAAPLRRTRGGGAALRLSARSGALLVEQAQFASGDRLRLESTSYKPIAASKAFPGQSGAQAPSARVCIAAIARG